MNGMATLTNVGQALVDAQRRVQATSVPATPKTAAERMWIWIKDHPGSNQQQLKQALKLQTAAELAMLERAGMVRVELRPKSKHIPGGRSMIKHYFVKLPFNRDDFNAYRGTGTPRKAPVQAPAPAAQAPVQAPAQAPAQTAAPAQVPARETSPPPAPVVVTDKFDLGNLTHKQAKALYCQLRQMFNNLD